MNLVDRLLERPEVYSLWQAPFAGQKFAPVRRNNDLGSVRRVLDVGCGPGTNRTSVGQAEYVGIDLNLQYARRARDRWGNSYVAGDVTALPLTHWARFDFILVNSLLHHVETSDVRGLLEILSGMLEPGGTIHILDLVLPEDRGAAWWLARWDRGRFARPAAEWESLFSEHFETLLLEPYGLGIAGFTLWNMLYFKGRPRR